MTLGLLRVARHGCVRLAIALALAGCTATVRPSPVVVAPRVTVHPPVVLPSARVVTPPMGVTPTVDTPTVDTPEVLPPTALSAERPRMFRGQSEDVILNAMRTRPVVRVIERFNSSTMVFHLDLGDGVEIGFKPARRGEHNAWRHEIAGYRLARALGIQGRVPPAITRRVPLSALHGYTRGARLVVTGRERMVEGAAIYWMPVLRHSHLQSDTGVRTWNAWMDPERAVPAEFSALARELSTLLVFDYLQANFDRWNAANTPVDEHGDLVLRDNNRGWYTQNLRRLDRGGLDAIRRLPASLLAGVTSATASVLHAEMNNDPGRRHGGLHRRDYGFYTLRRQALLDHVTDLIGRYGREAVLAW